VARFRAPAALISLRGVRVSGTAQQIGALLHAIIFGKFAPSIEADPC
jgi:hypothetical protein